jgi:hypothetical protein
VFTLLEGIEGVPQTVGATRKRGTHNDELSYECTFLPDQVGDSVARSKRSLEVEMDREESHIGEGVFKCRLLDCKGLCVLSPQRGYALSGQDTDHDSLLRLGTIPGRQGLRFHLCSQAAGT